MDLTANDLEPAFDANDRWLRDLARRLVRDPELAADLAQQTWLSVFSSAREQAVQRGLLRVALRNVLLNFRRSQERRARREAQDAPPPAEPEAADLLARVEAQRAVAAALLTLAEPYRGTLLRRFVEGLPPQAIAMRTNVPVETVKTRLKRGLELLRGALVLQAAQNPQSRDRLALGLCIVGKWNPLVAVAWRGLAMAMSAKLASSAAAVIVVCAGVWLASWSAPQEVREDSPPLVARAPAVPVVGPTPAIASERVEIAPDAPDAAAAESPAPAVAPDAPVIVRHFEVRVLDLDMQGVPDLEVAAIRHVAGTSTRIATARSDGAGIARIGIPSTEHVGVVCADPDWIALTHCLQNVGPADAIVDLLVAPRVRVRGVIVDDDGRPINRVNFLRSDRPTLEQRLARPLVGATFARAGDFTGPDGTFTLDTAYVSGAYIAAYRDGFEQTSVELPQERDATVRITMKRLPGTFLRGHVVTSDGRVPPRASVTLGIDGIACDFDGRFELALDRKNSMTRMRAVAAGHLPGEVERPASGWPSDIEIRLGGAPLTIAGVVQDANGKSLEGVRIALVDPTPMGCKEFMYTPLEEMLSGTSAPIVTDADGRFEVGGLVARAYALDVLDPRTLLGTQVAATPAGTRDVVVRLPTRSLLSNVRGRVVTPDGNAVVGAQLSVQRQTGRWIVTQAGEPVTTDGYGGFTLRSLAPGGAMLVVAGRDLLPFEISIDDAHKTDFVLTVERVHYFRIQLPHDQEATFFRVEDAENMPLSMWGGSVGRQGWSSVAAIGHGASEILGVSPRAATIVYLTGDRDSDDVLRRVPLRLKPGELTLVTD